MTSLLCCFVSAVVPVGAQTVPSTAPSSAAAVRQAVVAARLRLDAALAARDTAAIASLLADDALLIQPHDTLHGRPAIAAFVAGGLAAVPEVALSYAPERMDACVDGALHETGGTYVLLLRTYVRTDTLRGRYAARWVTAGDGSVRLATVVLARSLGEGGQAPRLATCAPAQRAALVRKRLQILLPTPFAAGTWRTVGTFEGTLRARGYGSGLVPAFLASHPTREDDLPFTLGARVAVVPRWSVEATVAIDPKRAEIRGFRPGDSSYVKADYAGRYGAVLISYERGWVRAGAGPALLRNRWAIEEAQGYDAGAGGWQYTPRGNSSYTELELGVVAQAAVMFPVSSHVFIDGRAGLRQFPSRTTPATGRLAPLTVRHSGLSISLGIGGAL
ncbi:MAG TPA: DUF4440 domain-containing protein [Gemmatimonadales bacterium]|nr:DUF4440 domain-containing protein [Gemmatimonadales bacterium]